MEKKILSWSDFLYIGFSLAVIMSIRDDSREEFLLLILVGAFFVFTGIKENSNLLLEFVKKYPIYSVMTWIWTIYFMLFNRIEPRCDKYAISVYAVIFAGYSLAKLEDCEKRTAFIKLWMIMVILIVISILNFAINPPLNGRMQLFFINPNIEGYAIIIFLIVSLFFVPGKNLRIISAVIALVGIVCTSSKACSILYLFIVTGYIVRQIRDDNKRLVVNKKRFFWITMVTFLGIIVGAALLYKTGGNIIQRLGNRHLEAFTDIMNFINGRTQPVDYSTSTNQRLFDYTTALEFFPKGSIIEILLGRGLMHQFIYVMRPTFIRLFSITTGGLGGPAENTFLSLMYDSGAIAFAMYGGVFISIAISTIKGRGDFLKKISFLLLCLMLLGLTVDMEYLIGIMFVEWILIGIYFGTISIEEKKRILIPSVIGTAFIIPIICFLPNILSWARTISNGKKVIINHGYMMSVIIIFVAMIIALLSVIYCVSTSASELFFYRRMRIKIMIVIAVGAAFIGVGYFCCSQYIERISIYIIDRIDAERTILSDIEEITDGALYVDTFSEAYDREIGGISNAVFRLRELIAYDNVTILTDKSTDSHLFENKGFVYTPISDWDAIYTNDEAVIKYFEGKGFRFTSFCSDQIEVNTIDNAAIASMYDGRYTATYLLNTDSSSFDEDYEVGVIRVIRDSDGKVLAENHINRSQFDENGNLTYSVTFNIFNSGLYKIKYMVESTDEKVINCKALSYTKSPEYDVRIKINEIGKQKSVEYYDMEGNPYEMTGGYYGIDNIYDEAGNAIETTYLGKDSKPTITDYGYAILKREYNDKAQSIKYSYYDLSGNKVKILGGSASEEYGYDDKGYINEIRYYGIDDEPILYFDQYFCIKKVINENGQEIHRDYYGIDGNPVLIQGEYSSADFIYNDAGVLSKVIYYNSDGEFVREESK